MDDFTDLFKAADFLTYEYTDGDLIDARITVASHMFEIVTKIRNEMKVRDVTLADAAEWTGLRPETLSEHLKNPRLMRMWEFLMICKMMQIAPQKTIGRGWKNKDGED